MRLLKWVVLFVLSFLFAWIVIFTFIQEPFMQAVPGKVLMYETPAVPIYLYLAGALVLGLAVGLGISLYYYVTLSAEIRRRKKEVRGLEEELDGVKRDLARRTAAEPSPPAPVPPAAKPAPLDEDLSEEGLKQPDLTADERASDPESFLDDNEEAGGAPT
jgi:hypothetical protein